MTTQDRSRGVARRHPCSTAIRTFTCLADHILIGHSLEGS